MSANLLKKIEQSKKRAIQGGETFIFKKTDITKEHLLDGPRPQILYNWYQTPSKVGIQIPYMLANKDDLKVVFKEESLLIEFPIQGGGHYHLDLDLFRKIIPQRSKKTHRLNYIEIVLEKKEQEINWIAIQKDGKGLPEGTQKQKISYPSSSKVKRDWDKIDKQLEWEIEKHGEEYGEDPGMNFFKQIFKNADPDKRRAMMKSFQSSSGTVLSTDWDDVSKKDYEGKDRPSPPKGQQWKERQY